LTERGCCGSLTKVAEYAASRLLPLRPEEARELARTLRVAWEEFLHTGKLLPVVRAPIAESWRRSREMGVSPAQVHAPIERGYERLLRSQQRQLLVRAAERIVNRVDDLTEGAALTLTLADADGLVLVHRGNPEMLRRGEAIGMVPGSRWSELDAGTNGMGTALFTGQTVQVFAAEHYCEAFHSVICTAAPVRHPITGQLLGVFDITADFEEGNLRLWALATQTALAIETELRELLMSGDRMLLEALAMAEEGTAAYAVDLEGRRMIGNRGAVRMVAPEDHRNLWSFIKAALGSRESVVRSHQLHNGRLVVVRVTPVTVGDETVGALVVLKEARSVGKPSRMRDPEPDWAPFFPSSGWLSTAKAAAASDAPILIVGESGSGKSAMAAALHRIRKPHGALKLIDCRAVTPASWEAEFSTILSQPRGTVLFEDLQDLDPSLWPRLATMLDQLAERSDVSVMATATAESEAGLRRMGLRDDVLDRIAVHVVAIPPLRERVDEFDRIVHEVLTEVSRERPSASPLITDEALDLLRAYNWPGNVRQLQNILRRALAERPRSTLEAKDLPTEVLVGVAGRRLGRIEQMEVEAILNALRMTGGNVTKAAEHLGLSRATVYRRLHAYQVRRSRRGRREHSARLSS
jgi:transcriptional regulator of acetoin/glycerol metabolism